MRYRNIATTSAFYQLTRRRPKLARAMLTKGAKRGIGSAEVVREHFQPAYDPWDQRLCLVPDGDLFDGLRGGRARVVTDTIDRFTPSGILLSSGRELDADIIVTATGLTLKFAGGIAISVDGRSRETGELVTCRGAMFGGVPNLAACVGLRQRVMDAARRSHQPLRLPVDRADAGARVALGDTTTPDGLAGRPLLPLTSGYVRRSQGALPQQGDAAPWVMRQSYLPDRRDLRRADLTEAMAFTS